MGLDLHPGRRKAIPDEDGRWDYDYTYWPQWSYGGFARFRERLAEFEGFRLDDMKGFGGERDWTEVSTELEPLLNHSDCDGEMGPAECERVIPRLTGILAAWSTEDGGQFDYDVRSGEELVKAMQQCVTSDMTLLFR